MNNTEEMQMSGNRDLFFSENMVDIYRLPIYNTHKIYR